MMCSNVDVSARIVDMLKRRMLQSALKFAAVVAAYGLVSMVVEIGRSMIQLS